MGGPTDETIAACSDWRGGLAASGLYRGAGLPETFRSHDGYLQGIGDPRRLPDSGPMERGSAGGPTLTGRLVDDFRRSATRRPGIRTDRIQSEPENSRGALPRSPRDRRYPSVRSASDPHNRRDRRFHTGFITATILPDQEPGSAGAVPASFGSFLRGRSVGSHPADGRGGA